MSENYGRCPLCGGDKKPGTTTFVVDLKVGLVIIRAVPACVCVNCGDAWIEDEVMARLETVVDDARRKQSVIEVTQWQNVAA